MPEFLKLRSAGFEHGSRLKGVPTSQFREGNTPTKRLERIAFAA